MAARNDFEDLIHPPSKQDFENFSEKKKLKAFFTSFTHIRNTI